MGGWRRRAGFLFATMFVAAACTPDRAGGPAARPGDKISVTVYFQGHLTGRYSFLVVHAFRGARLRLKELNADVAFPADVTLERGNTPDEGFVFELVENVVRDPKTVAVVGPTFSGESQEAGPTYDVAGIPFITPSAPDPDLAREHWDYWYRTRADGDVEGPAIGERMAQEYRSIYVAHDTYGFTKDLATMVAEVARARGTKIVAIKGYEPADDYSALISDVKASDAEAMFYGGYDVQTASIVRQAREAGLHIPIWSGEGSVSELLLEEAGDSATNMVLACPCNLEGRGDFLARYNAEYGQTPVPLFAAEGYDVAGLIGEGIRSAVRTGAREPSAIREGIKEYLDGLSLDDPYEGVAQDIAFNPETHELATVDSRTLIFFYRVERGAFITDGSAAELMPA